MDARAGVPTARRSIISAEPSTHRLWYPRMRLRPGQAQYTDVRTPVLEDPLARNRGPRRGAHVFFGYITLVTVVGWVLIGWSVSRLGWSDFSAMGSGFAL